MKKMIDLGLIYLRIARWVFLPGALAILWNSLLDCFGENRWFCPMAVPKFFLSASIVFIFFGWLLASLIPRLCRRR
jgi:hypothetical protein